MKYVRKFAANYCVLDLETTGLSCDTCEIIEVGILRIRNHQIIEQYQTLVHPKQPINSFITSLTGIDNTMVATAPEIENLNQTIENFIGNDLIVGHNTKFDLGFLSKHIKIENEYTDTLRISYKSFPELKRHRLSDLREYLHLSINAHRSISDCITTYQLYETMRKLHESGIRSLQNYLD